MCAFQRIVPHRLAVPSMLKAQIGWESFFSGKFARDKSPRSMKFPVAPESMRAVVLTVCCPMSSLTGKWRVRSLGEATSTWEVVGEGNIEVASPFKNPEQRRQKFHPLVLRNTFGVLEVSPSHSFPESSGN